MKTTNYWLFPIGNYKGAIPVGPDHPGSFGAVRKHDIHTGVDLYTKEGTPVYAVESGTVIAIEDFTGPDAESPWWLPTKAVLIEGYSGIVCYGEIEPDADSIRLWEKVGIGQFIGNVVPVLKEEPNPNIPNHSRCMLHLELHKLGAKNTVWWYHKEDQPEYLVDPTKRLLDSLQDEREDKNDHRIHHHSRRVQRRGRTTELSGHDSDSKPDSESEG